MTREKALNRIARLYGMAAVFVLTGCATNIVPADGDTYLATKTSAKGMFASGSGVKADVYEEANAFCAKKGLQLETVNVTAQNGIPFRAGNAELQFRCVPPKRAER